MVDRRVALADVAWHERHRDALVEVAEMLAETAAHLSGWAQQGWFEGVEAPREPDAVEPEARRSPLDVLRVCTFAADGRDRASAAMAVMDAFVWGEGAARMMLKRRKAPGVVGAMTAYADTINDGTIRDVVGGIRNPWGDAEPDGNKAPRTPPK